MIYIITSKYGSSIYGVVKGPVGADLAALEQEFRSLRPKSDDDAFPDWLVDQRGFENVPQTVYSLSEWRL